MALKPIQTSTGDAIADRRFAYGASAFADGDWQAAADLAGQTIELVPGFAPAHALLGRALAAIGRNEAAIAALSEAVSLDADDALGVRIDLAKLGATTADDAIRPGYIKALFDAYADQFDGHLVGTLRYRGPEVLVDAITRACSTLGRQPGFKLALDLGCGTGLVAKALGPNVRRIEGVDLSPNMVAVAARTGLYAALHVSDAVAELDRRASGSIDLIVAADTVVYMGDLFPLARAAARVLSKGGLLAFTVQSQHRPGHHGEVYQAPGYVLGVDARYAHSDGYLRTVADDSGLAVALFETVSTRQDRGIDVPGYAVVWTPR